MRPRRGLCCRCRARTTPTSRDIPITTRCGPSIPIEERAAAGAPKRQPHRSRPPHRGHAHSQTSEGSGRIFGVGLVGEVIPGEGEATARYARYFALEPPVGFEEVGGDPRANQTNAINRVSVEWVDRVLAARRSTRATLPMVVSDPMPTSDIPAWSPNQAFLDAARQFRLSAPDPPVQAIRRSRLQGRVGCHPAPYPLGGGHPSARLRGAGHQAHRWAHDSG